MRNQRGGAERGKLHLASQQIGNCLPAALVWHVGERNPGNAGEPFGDDVLGTARSGGCISDTGFAFGKRYQLRD